MSKPLHEQLLDEGARTAPEPETAEEHSRRRGMKTAAGGVVAGGVALAKLGIAGKLVFWFLAWHALVGLFGLGGWIGILAVGVVATVFLVLRARRDETV